MRMVENNRWPLEALTDVSERIFVGIAAGRRHQGSADVPVVNVGDLREGLVAPRDELHVLQLDAGPAVDRYRVQAGDVLVTCRGTQLRVARVGEGTDGALASSNLVVVRPGPRLLGPIVFAFLNSPRGQALLLSRNRSSTSAIALTARGIGALKVPVPPLELQLRVAQLIEVAEQHHLVAVKAARLRRTLGHALVHRLLLTEPTGPSAAEEI